LAENSVLEPMTRLIGDWLIVDRELRLRVIADRVEEAVRIGDDPW
jgi:hypothetical protein